ncbi:hypothetical protein FBX98_101265 [Burkholderia sp. SJZ115]|nr:hypothetical protein FB600_101265 [Burkholderia sp. SJZ089]TWD08900.1 hypothetical protein FBX98_101265 [Burkholderia sp. SJZ115]TWD12035.1 hypothetical protein FB601_101266 [Burkholderia sp. SJZ091]
MSDVQIAHSSPRAAPLSARAADTPLALRRVVRRATHGDVPVSVDGRHSVVLKGPGATLQ